MSGMSVPYYLGSTIIAVRRGPKVHINPGPDFMFEAGDIILLQETETI